MRPGFAVLTAALAATLGAASAQTSIPPVLPGNPVPGVATPVSVTNPAFTDDSIICKYERNTGTLMMIQVCRTQRAWKAMEADAKEYMEYGFRGSHQCDSPVCGKVSGGS